MMSYQQDNLKDIADAIREKKGTTALIKPIDFASEILSIEGGSPPASTSPQSDFTGWTMPLTYLNCEADTFVYESACDITIIGLDGVATVTGNGTRKVTVVMDVTGTSDRQTPFTIKCVGVSATEYNGIAFHYGQDVGSNCLVVAKTVAGDPLTVQYVFVESSSLPTFSSNMTTWNSLYSHQIESFVFGGWSGKSIPGFFMDYCYSFNQPLDISGVTSIGNNFLNYCYSYNQPLTIPSGVTSIGTYFMYRCYSYNQPLDISNVTSIGNNFLNTCYSYNQPLDISGVTTIGDYFLNTCYSYNQPLDISGVTSIGNNFLNYCYSYNQPLDISGVTSIGNNFLYYCYSYNQPLDISGVTSIGNNFLNYCYSYNQPLTIPSGVTSIGTYFMYRCHSFVHLIYDAGVYPSDDGSLSQDINTKTSANGTGILVTGTNAQGLLDALPDSTSGRYRKLVPRS